jgi:hypothetical protein
MVLWLRTPPAEEGAGRTHPALLHARQAAAKPLVAAPMEAEDPQRHEGSRVHQGS